MFTWILKIEDTLSEYFMIITFARPVIKWPDLNLLLFTLFFCCASEEIPRGTAEECFESSKKWLNLYAGDVGENQNKWSSRWPAACGVRLRSTPSDIHLLISLHHGEPRLGGTSRGFSITSHRVTVKNIVIKPWWMALTLPLICRPSGRRPRRYQSTRVGVNVNVHRRAVCHARSQHAGEQLTLIRLQLGQ